MAYAEHWGKMANVDTVSYIQIRHSRMQYSSYNQSVKNN